MDEQLSFPICEICKRDNIIYRAMVLDGDLKVCGDCAMKLRDRRLRENRKWALNE